jgi:hypothetical protein
MRERYGHMREMRDMREREREEINEINDKELVGEWKRTSL